jgi:hypothetical protein
MPSGGWRVNAISNSHPIIVWVAVRFEWRSYGVSVTLICRISRVAKRKLNLASGLEKFNATKKSYELIVSIRSKLEHLFSYLQPYCFGGSCSSKPGKSICIMVWQFYTFLPQYFTQGSWGHSRCLHLNPGIHTSQPV